MWLWTGLFVGWLMSTQLFTNRFPDKMCALSADESNIGTAKRSHLWPINRWVNESIFDLDLQPWHHFLILPLLPLKYLLLDWLCTLQSTNNESHYIIWSEVKHIWSWFPLIVGFSTTNIWRTFILVSICCTTYGCDIQAISRQTTVGNAHVPQGWNVMVFTKIYFELTILY